MNQQERETIQKEIQLRIKHMAEYIGRAVEEKNKHRAFLEETEKKRTTFLPEVIAKERDQEWVELNKTLDNLLSLFAGSAEMFVTAVKKRDAELDLKDSAIASALSLIEISGSSLDYETSKKINENFKFNQPALRAIRTAYQSRNVSKVIVDEISKMIYNAEEVIENLLGNALGAFTYDGSLNSLAHGLAKIGELEGVEVVKMPDVEGFNAVIRQAAGLASTATRNAK